MLLRDNNTSQPETILQSINTIGIFQIVTMIIHRFYLQYSTERRVLKIHFGTSELYFKVLFNTLSKN